jgi:excisionase family DNA binding protein
VTLELLTVDQVAELCQVDARTVRRAIDRGELKASKLGQRGCWRITTAAVAAWVEARANVPIPAPVARRAAQPARIDDAPVPPLAAIPQSRRRQTRRAPGTIQVTPTMGRP